MQPTVRPARRDELERVNELRRMVNDLHVCGRPDIFRAGFCDELQQFLYTLYDSEDAEVIVAVSDGVICGFAMATVVRRPQSAYNLERAFYHVEEFGVDERYRRHGVASALMAYLKNNARAKGLTKIELDVWAFNDDALAFYEAAGLETYRRYMEADV